MMGFRYVCYVVVPISFVRVPVCWNSFRIFMDVPLMGSKGHFAVGFYASNSILTTDK